MTITHRSGKGLGYTGYPLQIFYMRTDYGRGTQTHLEKMVILEKWYSALKAYLPVVYEDKPDEYNTRIAPLIDDLSKEVEAMNATYLPEYEGLATCTDKEKEFCRIMRGVCERLDVITARSRVIDSVKIDYGMGDVFG